MDRIVLQALTRAVGHKSLMTLSILFTTSLLIASSSGLGEMKLKKSMISSCRLRRMEERVDELLREWDLFLWEKEQKSWKVLQKLVQIWRQSFQRQQSPGWLRKTGLIESMIAWSFMHLKPFSLTTLVLIYHSHKSPPGRRCRKLAYTLNTQTAAQFVYAISICPYQTNRALCYVLCANKWSLKSLQKKKKS